MKTVTILSLLSNDIENRVDELSTLGVVTFGPVVAGAGLAEDEVVWPEDLAVWSRPDAVHGPRFKVHEDGPRDEPATAGLVVVHIDPLQLQIRVALVPPGRVDAVLGADHLPELGPDLVAALASLDVQNLTHFRERERERERERVATAGVRERQTETETETERERWEIGG